VIALVTAERHSRTALALWEQWMENDWRPVAPLLFLHEVTSMLYRKTVQGVMGSKDARLALQEALSLDIHYLDPPGLSERAFELAAKFNQPNAYDAHYMALAEYLDCPLWTADERLYAQIHEGFAHVRYLGNYDEDRSLALLSSYLEDEEVGESEAA
jgi:predicted nucleic acid-binding protein